MTVPVGIPECPRGLEYLCTLDQLLVKQKHSLTEAMIGFEANNKYIIKNCLGQNVSKLFLQNSVHQNDARFQLFSGVHGS